MMKLSSLLLKAKLIVVIAFFGATLTSNAQMQIGQTLEGSTLSYEDITGYAVSMSDAYTIAYGTNGGWGDFSSVKVYCFNGTEWIQKGTEIIGEGRYLYSVSMPDANTFASGGNNVRVHKWNGEIWVQKGSTLPGGKVSMPDSITLAIGATFINDNGDTTGQTRVYVWTDGDWVQKGNDIGDSSSFYDDVFQSSMPDANTVAVPLSRYVNENEGITSTRVAIYNWSGDTWELKGSEFIGDTIYGTTGILHMPDNNTIAILEGGLVVYSWNGNEWVQKGCAIIGDTTFYGFGWAPNMPDANTLVARGDTFYIDQGYRIYEQYVRVYTWDGMNWVQKGNDIRSPYTENDFFGYSLSMPNASTLAIGVKGGGYGDYSTLGYVNVYSFCPPIFSTDAQNSINSFTWIDGNAYTTNNNVATYILTSAAGCDSVVTLNLTINEINIDSIVSESGNTLTVNATGVEFQWLDCDNNFAPIVGETSSTFTATTNGNYAVQLSGNNYLDTTDCFNLRIVGIVENSFSDKFNIFPNPTSGNLIISFDAIQEELNLSLYALDGKLIESRSAKNMTTFSFEIEAPAGMYLLKMYNKNKEAVVKVVKE
jgi:hypothetical protein